MLLALEKCCNLFFSVMSYALNNTSVGFISNSCAISDCCGKYLTSRITKLIFFTFFRFFSNNENTEIVSLSFTIFTTASFLF